ncbi:MAG: formate dehydrogenase accessory protein FdhE [Thermoanaerobaculia bacterium]
MTTAPAAADQSVGEAFGRRAQRALLLAAESAAARDPLLFAAALCRAQGEAAAALAGLPLTGSLESDFPAIEPRVRDVFRAAAAHGPAPLVEEARTRAEEDSGLVSTRLLVFWNGDRKAAEDYLSRAALRPYAEVLRFRRTPPDRIHRQGQCPACGGPPGIASRRDGSQLEGAKRRLHCALCGEEWTVNRIQCPACFEEDPSKLPSFQADRHPAVRIEACDTCRRYVKSIDLSLDARPIPEVDDLVSISLDLWAAEEGYTRIEPGLAGL